VFQVKGEWFYIEDINVVKGLIGIILFAILMAPVASQAQSLMYLDEAGNINFVSDVNQVPQQYRWQVTTPAPSGPKDKKAIRKYEKEEKKLAKKKEKEARKKKLEEEKEQKRAERAALKEKKKLEKQKKKDKKNR
jgi:hypothetical protein